MSLAALVILLLTTTASTVSGIEYEYEYNRVRNEFYGNQECFAAYYKLHKILFGKEDYNDRKVTKLIDTFCNGKCGSLLSNILQYEDRVKFYDRRVGQSLSLILYSIHICIDTNCTSFL